MSKCQSSTCPCPSFIRYEVYDDDEGLPGMESRVSGAR